MTSASVTEAAPLKPGDPEHACGPMQPSATVTEAEDVTFFDRVLTTAGLQRGRLGDRGGGPSSASGATSGTRSFNGAASVTEAEDTPCSRST